uniref:Uncharacterized protein n=2 Tax=Oryzias latipes TaxID=8090 RepID=A0A3P9I0E2_ORYLA
IGTLGQWVRKMKMASRLTVAHIMQKRMMPRQKVPPPPAGTTIRAAAPPAKKPIHQAPTQWGLSGVISVL